MLLLFNSNIWAQLNIHGTVSDSDGKKTKGILVALTNKQDLILSYTNTDSLGFYNITYPNFSKKDSLFIQINEIGFTNAKIPISETNQRIDIKLIVEYQNLNNVIVHASKPLLIEKSDTLKYNVDSFSTKQDRTILDVIKKLPGIDVMESGEIRFQGKSINALYVDGDNLVDGKYNALTKSIPNDMAASIEVLRNHQPVKTLQGVQFSDAPGLNIVLKNKGRLKMLFDGAAGVGSPSLYDAKLNGMTFKKSFKMLNTFKITNLGKDLKQDLISHFRTDADFIIDKTLLNTEIAFAPLAPSRSFLNKDILEDVNILLKSKQNLDIRINASYYTTSLNNERMAEQFFILPTDSIRYTESIKTNYKESLFRVGFNTLLNKKSTYFNYTFSFESLIGNAQSELYTSNLNNFKEFHKTNKSVFTNSLRYIKALSPKLILEAYSFIFHKNVPQQNEFSPGIYNSILNNNQAYNSLLQDGLTKGISSRNYFSLRLPGKINYAFKVGLDATNHQLISHLDKIITGSRIPIADTFTNNLNWKRNRLYSEYSLSKLSENTSLELNIPIEKNWIHYTDSTINEKYQFTFLQPSFKIRSKLGKTGVLNLSASSNKSIGSYYDIYGSYILNGYRSFISKGGILPVLKNDVASFSYEINNAPRFLFFITTFSINRSKSNVIPVFMLSNFSTSVINKELINTTVGYSYTVNIAKYFRNIKTLISIQPSFSRNEFNQLQNGYLLSYLNNSWNWNIKANTKISSFVYLNYAGTISRFSNKPKNQQSNSFTQVTNIGIHKADLSIALHPTLMLTGMTEFYSNSRKGNNQTNSITFFDLALDYRPEKSKIECKLSALNILNKFAYTTIGSSSNAYNQSSYNIRPRNIVLHLNYRF
jgi:hypothetical protein